MLGLMHKRVLDLNHPVFQKLLPFHNDVFGMPGYGHHNKQLYGHLQAANFQMALFCRFIFGMTYIYNTLPQEAVDCTNVSRFQRHLTIMARHRCRDGYPNWSRCLSSRVQNVHMHVLVIIF